MNEEMSEIFNKMNDMIKNNEIPEDFKNILNNFSNTSNMNNMSSSQNVNDNLNSENNAFNFDMNTMLKMKSIIDSMNKSQNDPRANLLRSLKPYLKPSRKEKVDQYIRLFSMGKVFEMMNPSKGGKEDNGA